MAVLLLLLVLIVNFAISWANAAYVGRYWSESKQLGGSFRAYIVAGYIMAIAGFSFFATCRSRARYNFDV